MTTRHDAPSSNRPFISDVAHVIARIGFAIAGGLCGLFVTAPLAKAGIDVLSSVELALAMILYGIIGFYFGIDIPIRPSRAWRADLSDGRLGPNADLAELLSAVGVFLATAAALVSVCVVVSDEVLPALWMVVVSISWLIGVAMQITVGVTGRIRKSDHVMG